jgi:hypothetical protein
VERTAWPQHRSVIYGALPSWKRARTSVSAENVLGAGSERRRFVGSVVLCEAATEVPSGQSDGGLGTAERMNSFCKRLVNPIRQYAANITASREIALSSSSSPRGKEWASPGSPSARLEGTSVAAIG